MSFDLKTLFRALLKVSNVLDARESRFVPDQEHTGNETFQIKGLFSIALKLGAD